MPSTDAASIKEYYRKIVEVDIGEVVHELIGNRITHKSGQRLHCDCPNHASESKQSLHIMLDKQGWYCFGCGVGGDVLQLVEFIESKTVTSGHAGPMPDSHRKARDYLAKKAELPPLSQYGLTPDRLQKVEQYRANELQTYQVLTALADIYHQRLKSNPEVLEWFKSKYGISDETIDNLKIGYSLNTGWKDAEGKNRLAILNDLTDGTYKFKHRDLARTGAFSTSKTKQLYPFFRERIVFPYWRGGRVVFMTARKTPWTPDNEYETGKYKKALVYDKERRPYISPCINNSTLYNEDCLLSNPDRLIITEGVTDCISLMEHGFTVSSPVTVRIRNEDWERIIPKLRRAKYIYLCQDNEISQVGFEGALQIAKVLRFHKIECRIISLPLEQKQRDARKELEERFCIQESMSSQELKDRLESRSEDEIKAAEILLADSKIDVNEYFAAGHTSADFEKLMLRAVPPIEYEILSLPTETPDVDLAEVIKPVLESLSWLPEIEQSRLLKMLQGRFSKRLTLGDLREQFKSFIRTRKANSKLAESRRKIVSNAPPGSCKEVIAHAKLESMENEASIDYAEIAERVYSWFLAHGGRFFRTSQGDPFMFFGKNVYWMDSFDRGKRRYYYGMIYEQTGFVATMNCGKTFIEVLASLAVTRGRLLNHLTWIHTEIAKQTIYFNLNNSEHQIAKITPDGVEILINGGNADEIVLADSTKMEPIEYMPDADLKEADRLLKELIVDNFSCSPSDSVLIIQWFSCFLLLEFAGTKPMTRFEGSSGSGKTTASKLITALLYGKPQQKKSTDAANYTDGAKNPLIALDNIETKQMTDELISFMLTSITGIAKEKRRSGSDTETVSEKTNCLINTTGIEPLSGELSEILTRSFVIQFDENVQTSDCFLETSILAEIKDKRNLIMSSLINRTSKVLKLMRDGTQEKIMSLLNSELKNHKKRRCNDYLSLMYLMAIEGMPAAEHKKALESLDDSFICQMKELNITSQRMASEANPIVATLTRLFSGYRNAIELDKKAQYNIGDRANHESGFLDRYQINFKSEVETSLLSGSELHAGLSKLANDFRCSFPYKNAGALGVRIKNDLEVIEETGFKIIRTRNTYRNANDYLIQYFGK